ncbi:MAG: peptidoglycan-binding domain-containing protein [Streptosporangiaceae bacterium]
MRRGSQGHPVPALQHLLRARGHLVTVDGIFGPKTEAAVEGFQTADRIRVPADLSARRPARVRTASLVGHAMHDNAGQSPFKE